MREILLAATALAMLSGSVAYAQTSTSGSNSQSTATNSSASQSSSTSNPRVNVIGTSMGNGTSSSVSGSRAIANTQSRSQSAAVGNRSNITVNTYAGIDGSANNSSGGRASAGGASGGSSSGNRASAGGASGGGSSDPGAAGGDPAYSINYSGGYSVRNVPEVIAPNVVGGNPCAIGASGGLAVSGFGISGGATWADKQCERRQQAALLYNIGKQKAAVELMCQDENVRVALRVSGEACTADQAVVQQPATVVAAPLVSAVTAPVAPVTTPVAVQKDRPEWCYTASAAEMRRHTECNVRS